MDPQDQTFMTIHNLTADANILFASDSIFDILGYQPDEVKGKSCFDYFHPEEVPFARSVHSRGVLLDKAAVLHYARILSRDGRWVSCECCFTIVHDVLVACTSIYLRGEKSERRALEAPQIRRIFSCSPRDPRYHMLEYLSPKFKMPPVEREPRAALILNRFTRNLSIMFATNAVSTILGLRPDEIKDKSFYECIQENCLQDAIRCLESAKANESIAYLRFWFRDPRVGDAGEQQESEEDEDEETEGTTSDSEGGGADLDEAMDVDSDVHPFDIHGRREFGRNDGGPGLSTHTSSSLSDAEAPAAFPTHVATPMYQTPGTSVSSAPSMLARHGPTLGSSRYRRPEEPGSFELEAVVSCTSDGLVVVLRKARPPIPAPHPPLVSAFTYENGLFAAPWGQSPIQPQVPPDLLYTFRPPLLPQHMPLRESVKAAGGPPMDQLMRSIRDVAVFAWALVGINGNLAMYSQGSPRGEAQPEALPIWDPDAGSTGYQGPENQAARRWLPRDQGKGKEKAASSTQYTPNLPHQPLEPEPQNHTRNLVQPSTLEHYTYGSSSTWTTPSAQFGGGRYEQANYRRLSDSFMSGPQVLPPLQPQYLSREPQTQLHQYGIQSQQHIHQQAHSHTPPAHGSTQFQDQPQDPHADLPTSQAYSQPASSMPPSATTSPPAQGNNKNNPRYLWQ